MIDQRLESRRHLVVIVIRAGRGRVRRDVRSAVPASCYPCAVDSGASRNSFPVPGISSSGKGVSGQLASVGSPGRPGFCVGTPQPSGRGPPLRGAPRDRVAEEYSVTLFLQALPRRILRVALGSQRTDAVAGSRPAWQRRAARGADRPSAESPGDLALDEDLRELPQRRVISRSVREPERPVTSSTAGARRVEPSMSNRRSEGDQTCRPRNFNGDEVGSSGSVRHGIRLLGFRADPTPSPSRISTTGSRKMRRPG